MILIVIKLTLLSAVQSVLVKAPLLNALFVAFYSDMEIRRTTATPQVYFENKKAR